MNIYIRTNAPVVYYRDAESHVHIHGFKEEEHPRGQPENAGQFASTGGAEKGSGGHVAEAVWNEQFKTWRPRVTKNGRERYLGAGFSSKEAAQAAAEAQANKYNRAAQPNEKPKSSSGLNLRKVNPSEFKEAIEKSDASKSYTDFSVESVPVDQLRAGYGQAEIHEPVVRRYMKELRESGSYDDHPFVIEYKGKLYVLDGHHRAEAALRLGKSTIKAHVEHIK